LKYKTVKYRKGFSILLFLCVGLYLLTGCAKKEEKTKENILGTVKEFTGYQREIGQEEYEFYTYFIERENTEQLTAEEMEKKVRDYANEVNALFHLANKLQLCEPYSYETLKMRMEQENEVRKVKKEKGEALYGLEQFTLKQFFQYRKDTVEAALRSYLEGHIDEYIIQQAKIYYEENKEKFHIRETVIYEESVQGTTETVTVDRNQLNFLADADPGLADFLASGEEQECYEDVHLEGNRKVVIKEIIYNKEGFESNREAAISAYIQQELFPELISIVAKNNPVQFGLDFMEKSVSGEPE